MLVRWLDDPGEPWGILNTRNDKIEPDIEPHEFTVGQVISAKCRGFDGMHRCEIDKITGEYCSVGLQF